MIARGRQHDAPRDPDPALGQSVQGQMQLGDAAIHPEMADALGELHVQQTGLQQLQQSALRIGAGGDDGRADLLAPGEDHADRGLLLHQDALDGGTGTDRRTGAHCRLGKRLGQRPHAAHGQMQAPHPMPAEAGETVEQAEHRIGRARTQEQAQCGVEGEQALHQIAREEILAEIGDVHRQDAGQLQEILLAEPAQLQGEETEGEIGPQAVCRRQRARRRLVEIATQRGRKSCQPRHHGPIGSPICRRDACDGGGRGLRIAREVDPRAVRRKGRRADGPAQGRTASAPDLWRRRDGRHGEDGRRRKP